MQERHTLSSHQRPNKACCVGAAAAETELLVNFGLRHAPSTTVVGQEGLDALGQQQDAYTSHRPPAQEQALLNGQNASTTFWLRRVLPKMELEDCNTQRQDRLSCAQPHQVSQAATLSQDHPSKQNTQMYGPWASAAAHNPAAAPHSRTFVPPADIHHVHMAETSQQATNTPAAVQHQPGNAVASASSGARLHHQAIHATCARPCWNAGSAGVAYQDQALIQMGQQPVDNPATTACQSYNVHTIHRQDPIKHPRANHFAGQAAVQGTIAPLLYAQQSTTAAVQGSQTLMPGMLEATIGSQQHQAQPPQQAVFGHPPTSLPQLPSQPSSAGTTAGIAGALNAGTSAPGPLPLTTINQNLGAQTAGSAAAAAASYRDAADKPDELAADPADSLLNAVNGLQVPSNLLDLLKEGSNAFEGLADLFSEDK